MRDLANESGTCSRLGAPTPSFFTKPPIHTSRFEIENRRPLSFLARDIENVMTELPGRQLVGKGETVRDHAWCRPSRPPYLSFHTE